jgi:tRNA A-37 threonylcarbamoyl transferase component Bud32
MKKSGERKIYDSKFPRKFITLMKKKKRKKIRNTSIDDHISEQKFNDASRII